MIVACGRDLPSSPSTACRDLSGVYDVTYDSVCSSQYPTQWTLVQNDCNVQTQLQADTPTVTGIVHGSTAHLTMKNGFTTCQYQLEGDAQFDGRTIRGSLSGSVSGPCCGIRDETLQLTAIRR